MPAPDYADEIANLEEAVAAGELTVEADGQRVTYQSMTDLRARLRYFQEKAQAATNSGPSGFGFSAVAYCRD